MQGPARRAPRHCEAPACGLATREGKPFCSSHVSAAPYVQAVAHGLAERERERLEIQARPQAARKSKLLVGDLVSHIAHNGSGTVEGLARALALPTDVLEALTSRLVRDGIASTRCLDRGRVAVDLVAATSLGVSA